MRLSAFDTFAMYMAIKMHFNSKSYDYFKYHGKTRVTQEQFINRRDKYMFQKLSRKYDSDEMLDFMVCSFAHSNAWVGDLLHDEAEDNYKEFKKRKQSLGYSFANELDKMFLLQAPELAFKATSNYALPIRMLMQGDLSLETFVLLNRYLGLVDSYNAKYGEDDIVWGKIGVLIQKFTPFLVFDDKKMKSILKDKINGNISREEQESSQTAYCGNQEVQESFESCR